MIMSRQTLRGVSPLDWEIRNLAVATMWLASGLLVWLSATSTNGQTLQLQRVASGLSSPVFATHAPGDPNRLFIVQQGGAIRILDLNTKTMNATPFLTVTGLSTGGERGLLGLAFDPNYQSNGRFYVNFTDATGATRVRRFTRQTADLADATSGFDIMTIAQPQANHNGGWMDFGRDGFLYVSVGDGGGSNDSGSGHTPGIGNAQDKSQLLGKMLRIDINGDDFPGDPLRNYRIPSSNPFVGQAGSAGEIWAYGLRNAWRNSFDRVTGDLWIADVGQGAREEINFQYASSLGGENYGWRLREGTIATPSGGVGGPKPSDAIDPIYEYLHGSGPFDGFSVTGGYVYRGPVGALNGHYFFSDYISNRLWSIKFAGGLPMDFDGTNFSHLIDWTPILTLDAGTFRRISSFGEDLAGNLYLVNHVDGQIFMIVGGSIPEPSAALVLACVVGFTVARRRRR